MYIYFDKNGTLKEIVADIPARKGSNDYNKIYVYLEGKTQEDISDIWYKQQFPDGTQSIEVSIKSNTVTKAIPYDKNIDMKFFQDYVEYPFYYINLNSSYLAQNGLNLATIRVVIGDEIFALGMITFNVETNVVVKDTDISQSQYDYIVTNLNTKVDKQSGSGNWKATISNEDGNINLESDDNDEFSKINLEGSTSSMVAQYDVDHKGYISFAGGNVSLYSLLGDYENEIYMGVNNFYLQRKDKEDNLVIHKIDLVNGTIDGRPFNYSDVKHYQITSYTSGTNEYNFTQTGIDTNNLVSFRLLFNTVDANKNLMINNKNVRLSTNPTNNATMGMLKSFKEDGANVYDFYAFYDGTYFYVINQNMYDKDVTMTHITLGSLSGTLSTSIQQSISYNGIETLFNITAYSGLLPILFRPYQISNGAYRYKSITPLEDADGSYYYEGSINLNDGTYDLSNKVYISSGTNVSGTNDGTNWTSITIGNDTYNIPSGSGGSGVGNNAYKLVFSGEKDETYQDINDVEQTSSLERTFEIIILKDQEQEIVSLVNQEMQTNFANLNEIAQMINQQISTLGNTDSNVLELYGKSIYVTSIFTKFLIFHTYEIIDAYMVEKWQLGKTLTELSNMYGLANLTYGSIFTRVSNVAISDYSFGGNGASTSSGEYYELITNDMALYDLNGNQVTTILTNLRITLSEGQFEALKTKANPMLTQMGMQPLTDIDSLATILNTVFTETIASNSNLAYVFFVLISGYCQYWVIDSISQVNFELVLALLGTGFKVLASDTNYPFFTSDGNDDIPMGISATWTLNKYGTSGGSPSTESYYKIVLKDECYNETNWYNTLTIFLHKEDFSTILDGVNQQMGTSLATPQDLIDFYDTVKGNTNLETELKQLFSTMAMFSKKAGLHSLYEEDFDGYVADLALVSGADIMILTLGSIFDMTPTDYNTIGFTSSSTLTITEVTSQKL